MQKVDDILPDLLVPGLRVVFCGTAAGDASAKAKAYYAGPGNKFWKILAEIKLTPGKFLPEDYWKLNELGIGLTDLAKRTSGADRTLRSKDFDVADFTQRLLAASPAIIAFNGKKAASVFFSPTVKISYGRQAQVLGNSAIYVLPSTSGAASGFWDRDPWVDLAHEILGGEGVKKKVS